MAAKVAACKGFVVLSNGFAVMSGMSEKGGHGTMAMGGGHGKGMADGGHGRSHAGTGHGHQATGHASMGHGHQAMGHGSGTEDPLMCLRHGDDVPVTAGRLCVPVDDAAESWVAVTAQGDLHACRITTEAWLDHYVAVTSGEVTDFVGRLDDALPTPRPTDAERRELIAFLRSLGSDYASEWTREPGAGPR